MKEKYEWPREKPRWKPGWKTRRVNRNPFFFRPGDDLWVEPRWVSILGLLFFLWVPLLLLDVGYDIQKCRVIWEGERQVSHDEFYSLANQGRLRSCPGVEGGFTRIESTSEGSVYHITQETEYVSAHVGVVGTSIPIATLMYLVAAYIGKFYAERRAIQINYGPYADGKSKTRTSFARLSPSLLLIWVRSPIDHVPPMMFIALGWWIGLGLSLLIDLVFLIAVSDFNFPVLSLCYLMASSAGKSFSERQLMDEKYGY